MSPLLMAMNASSGVSHHALVLGTWTASTNTAASQGIFYSGTKWVTAQYGTATSSNTPDGITWTSRSMPSSQLWYPITSNGSGTVIQGIGGTTSSMAYSTNNGDTFSAGSLSTSMSTNNSAAYGNGVYMFVFGGGSTTNSIQTSPNGITWTNRTATSGDYWVPVAYSGSLWWVGSMNTTAAMTSANDGVTWTARGQSMGSSPNAAKKAAFGAGLFVVVGEDTSAATMAQTSPDGINWTFRTLPSSGNYIGLSFYNTLFMATKISSSESAYSTDGITWTARSLPSSTSWYAVAGGSGKFVATTANTAAAYITWA